MTTVTIPNLPVAIALSGSEQMEAVQGGVSSRITTAQIAGLAVGGTYPPAGIPISTGSAWGLSYTTSGTGQVLALATGATIDTATITTPTISGGSASSMSYSTGSITGSTIATTSIDSSPIGFTTRSTGAFTDLTLTNALTGANGGTGLTGFTAANNAIYSTSSSALTAGTLPVAAGGTGVTGTPANGQLLIGNGTGFSLNTLSAGSGITINNTAGVITIIASGTSGVSTFSAGTTGFTPSVATAGAVTLAGTLIVGNGGTGATTLTGYVKGTGTAALTASASIPNTDVSGLGTMSTQNAGTVAITGGSINNTTIGASTANTGAFTTVSATGVITSTVATGTSPFTIASTTVVPNLNASTLGGATFASPGAIGGTTRSTGAFTTLNVTGAITSTLVTGTAPLVVASTTNVANLNASSLNGATFSAPGTIGNTTAGLITGTTITANTTFTGPIGGATPAAGAFTTLTASTNISSTRINPRIGTVTSSATITPTGDASDQYNVTAQAVGGTFAIPSGTPVNGQKLTLRIKDNGTAQTLAWTTSAGGYRAIGVTLPTTTVISKTLYVGCIYNTADSFWDVIAVAQQA